jgi:hypothetical protein
MSEPLSTLAAALIEAFDERYELLGPLEGNWQEVCLASALATFAARLECGGDHRQLLLDVAVELERWGLDQSRPQPRTGVTAVLPPVAETCCRSAAEG